MSQSQLSPQIQIDTLLSSEKLKSGTLFYKSQVAYSRESPGDSWPRVQKKWYLAIPFHFHGELDVGMHGVQVAKSLWKLLVCVAKLQIQHPHVCASISVQSDWNWWFPSWKLSFGESGDPIEVPMTFWWLVGMFCTEFSKKIILANVTSISTSTISVPCNALQCGWLFMST